MKNLKFYLFFFSALFFFSCSTEVEINGEWQATPVVFGVIDQSKSEHFIKVNKTFLGDLPASEMASISDSLFYNDVQINLYRKLGNNNAEFVTSFFPTDEVPKDSGYFAYDRNTIYKANADLVANAYNPSSGLVDSYEYQLEVIVNDIAKTLTASTELISGTYISTPSSQAPSIGVFNYSSDFPYSYETGTNGKVFQMTIRFNYLEVIDGDTTDQAISIDWNQAVKIIETASTNGTTVNNTFSVLAFYNMLMSNIPVKENVRRLVKMPNSVEFRLAAGDDDLNTYMQISAPAGGLAQTKPLFTNITNGIGLFASRMNIVRTQKLSNRSLDTISRGIYTKNLGFADHYDPYYDPFLK